MIRTALKMIFKWMGFKKELRGLDLKISRAENRLAALHERTVAIVAQSEKAEKAYTTEQQRLRDVLRGHEIEITKLTEALTASRDALQTANEITIPGLVSANRVFIERWDAEIRVQALRSGHIQHQREES